MASRGELRMQDSPVRRNKGLRGEGTEAERTGGAMSQGQGLGDAQGNGHDLENILQRSENWRGYIARKQRWLLFLRHVCTCNAEPGTCQHGQACESSKLLWRHAIQCLDPNCQFPRCVSTRVLLRHHQRCVSTNCALCTPVKQYVQRERLILQEQSRPVVRESQTSSSCNSSNYNVNSAQRANDNSRYRKTTAEMGGSQTRRFSVPDGARQIMTKTASVVRPSSLALPRGSDGVRLLNASQKAKGQRKQVLEHHAEEPSPSRDEREATSSHQEDRVKDAAAHIQSLTGSLLPVTKNTKTSRQMHAKRTFAHSQETKGFEASVPLELNVRVSLGRNSHALNGKDISVLSMQPSACKCRNLHRPLELNIGLRIENISPVFKNEACSGPSHRYKKRRILATVEISDEQDLPHVNCSVQDFRSRQSHVTCTKA